MSIDQVADQRNERASFVNDLRNMRGAEARKLTFGVAFGAMLGYYAAQLLFALLVVGSMAGIVAAIVLLTR